MLFRSVHLPILGNEGGTSPDKIDAVDAGRNNEESSRDEKNDQVDDLQGELAEIIRDLTGRSSS